MLSKQVREDPFDKMEAVGETVTLEERAPNLREAQLDQAIGELVELLFSAVGLRLGLKRPREELDKGGQAELVHVVHFQ